MPPLELLRKMSQLNNCVSRTFVKLSSVTATWLVLGRGALFSGRTQVLEFCIRIKDTVQEHSALYGRASSSTYSAQLGSVYGRFH